MTLAIHEKIESSSAINESANQAEVHEPLELNPTEVVIIYGESGSPNSHNSGRKAHNYNSQKGITVGGNELSKFSDTPGDASLDDLFQPIDKKHLDD
ncbi:hypothetical protein L1987_20327 [Smallanthus sonchifolius]|uniref:Uncharacterized protein n=1 Tax=Smallanthus sonchifolius TaxID=185202 RepID=A0ACB9IRR8_9ASTR|nr:hypothetical protein L1987_20327 [Smallanthus sonchifolius]